MEVGALHLMKFTLTSISVLLLVSTTMEKKSQREEKGDRKGQLFKQSLAVV